MSAITSWDFSILEAIEGIRNEVLTFILRIFTYMGEAGWFWILLCIVLLIIPKTRKIGIYAAAALAIQFLLGEVLTKNLVCRDRPFIQHPDIDTIIKHPSGYSFPSGHTSSSISVALSVFFHNKKLGAPLIVIAIIIIFSRLYFEVHFPTDIIGGLILGTAMAIIVYFVLGHFFKKKKTDE